MNDLPLADLDAFSAVAVARSFRAAARARGVSASSLSEAVRRLEDRLGIRLLNRTTRSVTATEAGERLLTGLAPSLAGISEALEAVNSFRDSPAGTLRLNVPGIVGRAILPDIACRFLAAHPNITLEVIAQDSFVDVLAEGYDAGIRYDERLEQDMIAVPVGPRRQRYVAAASPAYLAAHGTPRHPRELLEHQSVRHRFLSRTMLPMEFERDGQELKVAPPARLASNVIELELAAAIAGLGIIATFEEVLAESIACGRLVRILEDWTPEFSGPFLYYASRKHMPPPLRAFIDFIKADNRASA